MKHELRNGDLVRVSPENIAHTYEYWNPEGLLGIVVDDIDALEEVKLYGPVAGCMSWWNIECLELIQTGGGQAYGERRK